MKMSNTKTPGIDSFNQARGSSEFAWECPSPSPPPCRLKSSSSSATTASLPGLSWVSSGGGPYS